MQDCSALAMEMLQSCTRPLKCFHCVAVQYSKVKILLPMKRFHHKFLVMTCISYIPSSARRRSGSARYFSVWHYRIAEKLHNNDADSSLRSMFTFSRPITALHTGALAVQGHGQVTCPRFQHDTYICSFIG